MQIYELLTLRERVELDVNTIENKLILSLDHYLFQFPLQKQLAYAYLKRSDDIVKLSVLHKLFKDFDQISYFESLTHKKLLINDSIYQRVVARYIRNPWTWVNSMQSIQPYFFDAKYLLIGEYQKIAKKCSDAYFKVQFNHWSIPYSQLKHVEHLNTHNKWFTQRRQVEISFFTKMLRGLEISNDLRVRYYYKYIEFYDDKSQTTLQFELSKYGVQLRLLWLRGSRKCSRTTNQLQLMSFLQRRSALFTLYQRLMQNLTVVNSYFDELNAIDVENHHSFELLKGTMLEFLTDLHNNETATYIDSCWLNGYAAHHNSVERIKMSAKKGMIRVYRQIKHLNDSLNRSDVLSYSSYRLPIKDIDEQAKELLYSGYLSFSKSTEIHTMFDYELLADGKSNEFALQYFKMPSFDAKNIFDEYDLLSDVLAAEVQHLIDIGVDAKDTRHTKSQIDQYLSTSFEWLALQDDDIEFADTRKQRLTAKRIRIKEYLSKYNEHIKHFSND